MSSFQTSIPASLSVLDASASRIIVIDGINIAFYQDDITDDLMTYTDNEALDYQPLLFPNATKVIKISGGKIVISDECFVENTDNEDCNICMERKDILFKGLCPCNLKECKECFLLRVSSQFHNNYANTRCLSNNHKGNNYCKMVKEKETRIETIKPITATQIIKYRREKELMRLMTEYTYDVYEANVKDKSFDELPLCFKIFKNLCDLVEDMILVGSERDETINRKKQYYFYLSDGEDKPIRWGENGYDWDINTDWIYANTTFYVMYRDKIHKRFYRMRISFDDREQILDTLESHITDNPLYYGRAYCFDLLASKFQLALGNSSESEQFQTITQNDDFQDLIYEMIDHDKTADVSKEIYDNGDVDIVELTGCESMKFDVMDGHDEREYNILIYDDGVELNQPSITTTR
jgi:hypothetical protein